MPKNEGMEKGLRENHTNKRLLLITPGSAEVVIIPLTTCPSVSHKGFVFLIAANIFIATARTDE